MQLISQLLPTPTSINFAQYYMTPAIPDGTADRLVRNPHVLPHMPAALAGMIAYNRHQETLGSLAEAAYKQRRERMEKRQMALRRQVSDATGETAVASETESEAEIADLPTESPALNRRKLRRRSMFEAAQQLKSPERPEPTPPYLIRSRSLSNSSQTSPSVYFWSCEKIVPGADRVRARCTLFKTPRPGLWTRRASTGSPPHPFWHTRLRQSYILAGNDAAWRRERENLMQMYRRDRQFQSLMERRMSQ